MGSFPLYSSSFGCSENPQPTLHGVERKSVNGLWLNCFLAWLNNPFLHMAALTGSSLSNIIYLHVFQFLRVLLYPHLFVPTVIVWKGNILFPTLRYIFLAGAPYPLSICTTTLLPCEAVERDSPMFFIPPQQFDRSQILSHSRSKVRTINGGLMLLELPTTRAPSLLLRVLLLLLLCSVFN